MPETKDIIKKLRKDHNLTQQQLADIVGAKTYTTITKWENGDNFPKGKDIKAMSEYFKVSADYILGLVDEPLNVREVVLKVKIPVLGKISCGDPIIAEENIEGYIHEAADDLPSGQLFYLTAKGDSMEPTIADGSHVLIRQQELVESGEIAAVIVNGDDEATLKRFRRQGDVMVLMPDNNKYDPIVVSDLKSVRILGKAVRVTRYL